MDSLSRHLVQFYTTKSLYAKRWVSSSSALLPTSQISLRKMQVVGPRRKLVPGEWTDEITQQDIDWVAFPNAVSRKIPNDIGRWEEADSNRSLQDEYCEWSVERNPEGKIVRVVFTAEGPEYWTALGRLQPETVLELYKKHNPGFEINREDLFDKDGQYVPNNIWNTSTKTGSIMHLIHPSNNLHAEINLAAEATVLRKDVSGRDIRDADHLTQCSNFGDPRRNSDPYIGIEVNNLARTGGLITVADPIGLYLHSFDCNGLEAPDDEDVKKFWNFTRGTPADPGKNRQAHWVRGVFEVPNGKGYLVSDIKDVRSGHYIQWGSQLADRIQVGLTGQLIRSGMHTATIYNCLGHRGSVVAMAMKMGMEETEELCGSYRGRADGITDLDE